MAEESGTTGETIAAKVLENSGGQKTVFAIGRSMGSQGERAAAIAYDTGSSDRSVASATVSSGKKESSKGPSVTDAIVDWLAHHLLRR